MFNRYRNISEEEKQKLKERKKNWTEFKKKYNTKQGKYKRWLNVIGNKRLTTF